MTSNWDRYEVTMAIALIILKVVTLIKGKMADLNSSGN